MDQTLYDKLWQAHIIPTKKSNDYLLYIDKHLLHEVTSPQAFLGLKKRKLPLWSNEANLAVVDHNVPTMKREQGVSCALARKQIDTLYKNCHEHKIECFKLNDRRQGIVHIIAPEQGITLPGMTIVCGDSHTATHGALGALAFGIGTSEVEHVLATQTLRANKMKNYRVKFVGENMPLGVYAKDLILEVIRTIGTEGAKGFVIEYSGDIIGKLSIESRMTICNMSIEAGSKSGLIQVDDKTIDYIKGRPYAPKSSQWLSAVEYWKTLHSDKKAFFAKETIIDINKIQPLVTWGTSPDMSATIDSSIPNEESCNSDAERKKLKQALAYMGLESEQPINGITIDKVFIGSCTNARIEDLREVAQTVKNKKVSNNIKQALIVPGSGLVKLQAEKEGLADIFITAGFSWRQPGCSMCLGMNEDKLSPYERCASTSNRNFEGRQGFKGRTHLMSPAMAAAAAIKGCITDVREII